MKRLSHWLPVLALTALLFAAYAPAQAQPIVVGAPVVYGPPVRTAYYYAPPVTTYYAAPVTSYYYAPPVTSYYTAPVTTYYAPPVTTYYAPVTTYYAPAPATVYTYRYGLFGRRVGTVVTYP
jgi:hypothetical protein